LFLFHSSPLPELKVPSELTVDDPRLHLSLLVLHSLVPQQPQGGAGPRPDEQREFFSLDEFAAIGKFFVEAAAQVLGEDAPLKVGGSDIAT
jgi:hypothetical protein